MRPVRPLILATAALAWFVTQTILSGQALAQGILRDSETEWLLRKVSTPIFEAGGLTPESVDIYLLNDRGLNAFVAGGQNVVLNAGTLMAADDIDEVLGVIAHETGHITGAHLARFSDGTKGATAISILSLLLGAAAIAAGAGDAGAAVLMGGQSAAQRKFLSYNRVQEASADQAGATYLQAAGISGRGLIQFFDRIRDQELLISAYQDEYVRSHPLTGNRIARLRARVEASPHYNTPPDRENQYWFRRVQAKLEGYLNRPDVTLRKYPETDQSVFARYARVYAYNKAIEWDKALAEASSLIDEYPADPYFHEIKAQIHFENGQVEESIPDFREANRLAPNQPLLMSGLAQALVSIEKPEYDREAVVILERAVLLEPFNDFAWRNLAIIHTRGGDEANAALATAELFTLYGQFGNAVMHARRATAAFPTGSPRWIRAQDILAYAENNMERSGRRRR